MAAIPPKVHSLAKQYEQNVERDWTEDQKHTRKSPSNPYIVVVNRPGTGSLTLYFK